MTFNQHSKERTFICVFSVRLLEKKMVILIVTSDRERERVCVAFAQLVAELRPSRRVVRPVVT